MAEPAEFVARIYFNGAIEGGGFTITDDLVVTCAHLVANETAQVVVDIPARSRSRQYTATVIGWRPLDSAERSGAVRDLCVLRLGERIDGFAAPVIALAAKNTGNPFRTIGFPADYDTGIEATGQIQGNLPGGWRQLDAVQQPGHAVARGFSGTPVFDVRLGAFIGLVGEADKANTKTGTMIPLDVFAQTFPDVARAITVGLIERWRRWEAARRAEIELRAALCASPLHVPTAVDPLWQEFTQRWPWHETLRRDLRTFIDASRGVELLPVRLRDAADAFEAIDCDESYPELLSQLRNAIPRTLLGDLRPLVREEDEKQREAGVHSAFNRRRVNLHEMHQAAYRLTRHAANPRFARCLLLAGRFGSGKTHFCASLLGRDPSDNALKLPVELSTSGDVGGEILAAARSASAIEWATLGDFDSMLGLLKSDDASALDVHVLFDDVHLPMRRNAELLPALTRFIDEYTALHSFHYLLTIQDAQYDRVATQTEFWLRQSAFGPDTGDDSESDFRISHAGGWLFLDDLNEEARTGQAILRNALGWAISPDETAVSRRVLAHPLTATILVDLGQNARSGAAAASLNFPEFVEHFWRRRKATLDPGPLTDAALDEAIALIAQLVSDLGESPPLRDLLRGAEESGRELFGVPWTADRMDAAVEVIEHASLIRTQLEDRNDPASRRLLLLVEAFWCHRLAVVLMRDVRGFTNAKKMSRAVRSWFAERSLPSVAEGTIEFLLLLLFRSDADRLRMPNEEAVDRTTAVARAAFAGNGLSTSAPWLAGARMDAVHQRRFLAAGLPSVVQSPDLRTTFSFLYFLRSATISPTERLESAARAFEAIGQHALGSYFVYFFERTLDDFESASELAGALLSMNGVEAIGVTPILAELAANRLEALAGDHNVLDVLIADYLRPLAQRIANEPRREGRWKRFRFREWLLQAILADLAHRYHIDLYGMLTKRRWYDGARIGIRFPLPLEMEREANIAIGARYRRPLELKERERFVKSLQIMIEDGDQRDRTAAFFIIRHTEPPSESERVIVRPELRPLLGSLSADEAFVSRVASFAGVFEANVEGFVRKNVPPRQPKRPSPPKPPSA